MGRAEAGCVIDFEHGQPDVWYVDAPFEAQGRAALRRLGAPGCGP